MRQRRHQVVVSIPSDQDDIIWWRSQSCCNREARGAVMARAIHVLPDVLMKFPAEYSCVLAAVRRILICRRCDRGQIYCMGICARDARREGQREARRRHQATPRGRAMHAERNRRYRARVRRVTDHGLAREHETAQWGGTGAPGWPERAVARRQVASTLQMSSLRAARFDLCTPGMPSSQGPPRREDPDQAPQSPP